MNGSSRLPRLEVLVVVSEMRSNATSAAIKPLLDELVRSKIFVEGRIASILLASILTVRFSCKSSSSKGLMAADVAFDLISETTTSTSKRGSLDEPFIEPKRDVRTVVCSTE
jgi:hypothetical protein